MYGRLVTQTSIKHTCVILCCCVLTLLSILVCYFYSATHQHLTHITQFIKRDALLQIAHIKIIKIVLYLDHKMLHINAPITVL